MDTSPRVLIVDDEVQIRRLLKIALESRNFKVGEAATGEEGIRRAASDHPDLVLLDLGLPDMEGVSVLQRIREWSAVPIVILSVRNTEHDIVSCLDAGADDYLVKPFRTGELIARLQTALRHRYTGPQDTVATIGPVTVDFEARLVRKRGTAVKLTATEYALFALFARNAGKVLTHRYLLEKIWGPAFAEETQYSRVFVGQLRKKLEDDPSKPTLLLTESGIGYRLAVDD